MDTQTIYPRVATVEPLAGKRLAVTFDDGTRKIYDCTPLLAEEVFAPLKDDVFFRCVKADSHGYAVIWSDDIDLAESELWINGV